MSGNKDRHHRHGHEREEAASTDAKDAITLSEEEEEEAEEQSRQQRNKGAPRDVHGRIIGVSVIGHQSKITLAADMKGLKAGTEGYVKNGDGLLAKFRIAIHDHRTAIAYVDLTPDQLQDHQEVVLNPTTMPKSSERRQDIKTRVIGVSVVTVGKGQKTKILIACGSNHGARDRMHGFIAGSDGKPYERFELTGVHSTHSEAIIDANIDTVQAHTSVVLNPADAR